MKEMFRSPDSAVRALARAWMAWLTEMTTLAYHSADELTYLYPEALDEAANRTRLIRAPLVQPAWIWEEERIENYTRENAAGER